MLTQFTASIILFLCLFHSVIPRLMIPLNHTVPIRCPQGTWWIFMGVYPAPTVASLSLTVLRLPSLLLAAPGLGESDLTLLPAVSLVNEGWTCTCDRETAFTMVIFFILKSHLMSSSPIRIPAGMLGQKSCLFSFELEVGQLPIYWDRVINGANTLGGRAERSAEKVQSWEWHCWAAGSDMLMAALLLDFIGTQTNRSFLLYPNLDHIESHFLCASKDRQMWKN